MESHTGSQDEEVDLSPTDGQPLRSSEGESIMLHTPLDFVNTGLLRELLIMRTNTGLIKIALVDK